ncbi:PH domain-containing protein [Modestobacter sp. NPDC049651]|uniref:PH domain-containing protein n=1 Tax=unclassified Modestobacter TaxID=2643866 RepID=UPI0033E012E3
MTPPSTPARLRMNRTWLLPVWAFAVCLLPLSAATPWLLLVLVVPAVLAAGVLRTGVDVDDAGVTARSLAGTRTVPWDRVAGLRVGRRSELWLVTTAGTELRLPSLRVRDLPLLSSVSGGRIPAP